VFLTPTTPMSLIDDNLDIRVLDKTFSKLSNCSSMAFMKSLTFWHFGIEPWILAKICVFMKKMERWLDLSRSSYNTISFEVLESVSSAGSFLQRA